MQAVVAAAQSVYDDEDATQDEVNAAAATLDQSNANSALSLAIAKLIPSNQINATKLYEAIRDDGGETNDDNTYTAASWAEYQSKLTAASTLLASYFDNGTPTDANVYSVEAQHAADAAADALTAAKAALVKRADRYHIIRSGVALAEIERLAAEYDPSKLDDTKYDGIPALVSARNAALQVLEASESITELTEAQFEAQADAMDALRTACYALADKEGPITVHLSVTDSYAPRQSNPQSRNVVTRDLSLPAGATVNDALTAAGISLTRVSTFQEIAVYLNGHYYVPEQASIFGGSARYLQAGLRDGDHLTLSFYEMPVAWSNDGTYRITVSLGEYMDDMRYQTVSAPATVKAGEAFTVSVTADGAMPGNYTGAAAPVEGAGIYAGAAFANRADAETAPVTEAVEAVTGADGKATVTLYAEGWCALNAFSTGSEEGKLVNGPSVLVYVEPADDLDAVKAALRAELKAAYENESYPETYFSETDWGKIETAYGTGLTGITDAATSGAAREAELTALRTIRGIQTAADNSNSSNLRAFRNLMDKLPEDVEKLDASSEQTIQSLIARYDAMTEYQRGQLTPAEESRYQSIKAKYESGFAPAKDYALSLVIDDSKVAAADREALAAMIGYLKEHTATCDTYSEVGGTKLAGLFTFNTPDSLAYVGTTFTEITTSPAMQTVAVCVSPDYAAYLLVRDANGTLSAADGSWSISDQSLVLDYDDVNVAYVNSGETFTVNGTRYEVQNVTVSGLDAEQFAEHTYSYYDSSDYQGKDEWHINMSFPGAFRRFTMPYSDVTVTVSWGPVSGTSDEITAAREAAAETIRAAYAEYHQADYSEANWTALTDVKDAALAKLQTQEANSLEAVRAIRQKALADMASVEKLSGSVAGLPDFGNTVGQVYISVENTTFPNCPYEQFRGEFLSGWYDLCEQDTMMTAILKALKTEGFSWEGTGTTGTTVDAKYSITYLSRIYIDSNGNGKCDAGEPRLGQFDGENGSGWMGTLNDFFVNSGFSDFKVTGNSPYVVEHGDEIKVVYTQNLGVDVGGTWNNSDTSLSDLRFSQGTLSPAFESGVLNYNLVISSEYASIKVTPSATNKNFLVKTFLNAYNKDSTYYKRTESIFVKPGDVIYVGVGEKGWPTMNSQGAEAGTYTGTKYTITVYAEGAVGIVARIEAAYKDIGKITYNSYTAYSATIAKLTEDYDALADKSGVTNLEKLTELQNKIAGFQAVDAVKAEIKALPASIALTDKAAVDAAMADYEALEVNKNLLTVAETNKLFKADNTIKVLSSLDKIAEKKDFAHTEANSAAQVKTALESWLIGLDLGSGVTVAVTVDDRTAASSSSDGSYSATVTLSIGEGGRMASAEKAVTGEINYIKSTDAGIKSITANGVNATGSDTAWSAVLPYGSDVATATVAVEPADGASASEPTTSDGGTTWTFTVTAEDGETKQDYTLTLSVNDVITTAAQSWAYIVGNDAEPITVTGLVEAVSTDALGLPVGTSTVSVWLEVTKTAQDGDDVTVNVVPKYSADCGEARNIPNAAMIGDATVTLPIAGTANARVLHGTEYLEATGSASGITFAARSGQYTLIPDALIARVTYHLNGGTAMGLTDGQQFSYYRGDALTLPEAERNGYTLKGWYGSADGSGSPVTAIGAGMPGELWAIWQSSDASATVTVSGVNATVSGTVFTVSLPFGSAHPAATDITITPADGATASTPVTEDDGVSWSFTVTAEDGTEKNYTLQVEIAEQTAAEKLAVAKATIEAADWTVAQATANEATALKTFVEDKLAGIALGGASASVTVGNVTPAVAGSKDGPDGTDGSYGFTVALTLGEDSTTASVSNAKITATAYVTPTPPTVTWSEALAGVQAYVTGITPNPTVGSTSGEWAVFALNRGGVATEGWNNKYIGNLQAYVDGCGGVLHDKKYTEYSRVVIALTSIGYDATKFTTASAVYDMVSPLLDKQDNGAYWAEWQGNNGTAFALLALDTHGYLDTDEGNAARAAFIASLKANQLESGAWSISGDAADLDVTAAAVYALAPYYLDSAKLSALGGTVSYAEVKAMVDNALTFLSGKQNEQGGLGSPEADVWAVIALTTLGRDPATETAFVKDGGSLVDDLLRYYDETTGGFKHEAGGTVNQMSSEQAAYGLAAYSRFKAGKTALYDMSDVELTLPEEVTVPVTGITVEPATASVEVGKTVTLTATVEPSNATDKTVTWTSSDERIATVSDGVVTGVKAGVVKITAKAGGKAAICTVTVTEAGGGGGTTPKDETITVTMRLIGADLSAKDIDLGSEAYLPDYVTWIPTTTYTLDKGAMVYDLWVMATGDAGIRSVGAEDDYVETVYAPSELGGYELSEFTNGPRSGWMYTVNGNHATRGLTNWTLNDGDVVVWHYINDYSYEVEDWFDEDPDYPALGDGTYWNLWLKAPDSFGGKGGGVGMSVKLRLIGAEKATNDVDLGKTAYAPSYVTWIPTGSYRMYEGGDAFTLLDTVSKMYGVSVNRSDNALTVNGLSDGDNGERSGWMVERTGSTGQYLEDGDSVLIHYVNDFSYEVPNINNLDPAKEFVYVVGELEYKGNGTYDRQWLKAPDTLGGKGGGVGNESSGSGSGGSGSNSTGSSEVAPAEVEVKPEVVNGEAKAEIKAEDVTKAIEEAGNAKTLTVNVETTDADKVEATLDAEAVKAAADAGLGLNVQTENGTIKVDSDTLKDAAKAGQDVAVTVTENADGTTTVSVTADGKEIDAKVKVELPAAKADQVLVVVNADGTETVVKKSVVENGKVYAELPAGAKVKVVDAEGGTYGDVKDSDWFAGAVEFVTSHGLFQGTDEGFEPEVTMSRAMLATVLYRLEDASTSGSSTFGDVDPAAWYADAAAWAQETGIITGTDKGFEPDKPVTREQIATILYRYANMIGLDTSASADLSKFPDGDTTSPWAGEAMAWAVSVGLFQGDETGALNPDGAATRAQVATLFERMIGLIVK